MALCKCQLLSQSSRNFIKLGPWSSTGCRNISFFSRKKKEEEEVEREVELVVAQSERRRITPYDGYLMKDRLNTLQSQHLLTTKKGYKPPPDVEDRICQVVKSICTVESDWRQVSLKDPRLKYKLLTKLIEDLKHDVTNFALNEMKTVEDVVKYFQQEVRETNEYEDLSLRPDLPPNLHIQLEYQRFNPETDTMHGGRTAFPGEKAEVKSIKFRRKYATVKTVKEKPGYYNHYFDY